jgi:DNA-binding HxlR family transcriptional regulator
MAGRSRSYGHFCMRAKALDQVGDRWTMLVVRDLAGGPKRFTDLMDRLGGTTPKTLTQRLRDLEDGGLAEVDRDTGRREVWYRLTLAGRDLLPALEELMLWGPRHVAEPGRVSPPTPSTSCGPPFRSSSNAMGYGLVHCVGSCAWSTTAPTSSAAMDTNGPSSEERSTSPTSSSPLRRMPSPGTWLSSRPMRSPEAPGIQVAGTKRAIRTFLKAVEVFPHGGEAPRETRTSTELRT